MTNLDLLPDEYRPRGPVNLHNLALIMLSLVLAFALVTITTSLIGKSQGYAKLLADLQAQMIPYRQQYKDIRVAQEKLRTLETRLPMIEDLINQRILWSHQLDELNRSLPDTGISLEEIALELSENNAATTPSTDVTNGGQSAGPQNVLPTAWLKVSGWSQEIGALSDLLQHLEKSAAFEAPTFITTEEKDVEGRTLLSFDFKIRLTESHTEQTLDSGTPNSGQRSTAGGK